MLPLQRHFSVQTRISIGPRDRERFPEGDAELGQALLSLVERVILDRGKLPRPSALAFRQDQIEQYDLKPVLEMGLDAHRFISAIAGQPGVESVALLGVMGVRYGAGRSSILSAVAFVEWPDCRWWSAVRPLADRALREDWPALQRSAVEGYPRPGGMGAWFSRARREQLQLHLGSSTQPGADLVH